MKAAGIVRRLDDLGRIVLPAELRKTRGIVDGTPLEMFVDGDGEESCGSTTQAATPAGNQVVSCGR